MVRLQGDFGGDGAFAPGERTLRTVADSVARRAGLFPGDLALVAPCGPGIAAAPLARAFTRCRVVALDDDPERLARVVANAAAVGAGGRLRPYLADPAALPFEDECFPLVACALALYAREDALEVLEELHRVAFWSGKLLAVEPDFTRLARKPRGAHRHLFDEDGLDALKSMGWGKVQVQRLELLPDGTVLEMVSAKRLDPDDGEEGGRDGE